MMMTEIEKNLWKEINITSCTSLKEFERTYTESFFLLLIFKTSKKLRTFLSILRANQFQPNITPPLSQ